MGSIPRRTLLQASREFLGKALWIHERVCERELLCVVHNKMFKYSLPFLESFSGKDRKNNVTPRL